MVQNINTDPENGRKPVVKVQHLVRKHTQEVDIETLNQQGVRKVNFITYSKINEIVALAVLKAFKKFGRSWDRVQANEIQHQATVELGKQLEAHGEQQADPQLLARQRQAVESDIRGLRPLVESQLADLADGSPDSPVGSLLSEESFAELGGRIRRVLASHLESSTLPDSQQLLDQLGRVVQTVLEAERQHLLEMVDEAARRKTDLLRRRLHKLQNHLNEMEATLKNLAAAKGIDPGVASIYKEIQGLSLEDEQYERKCGLLRIIFEDNLQLQKSSPFPEGAVAVQGGGP